MTAEVVADLREPAVETYGQVVAVRRHLLFTDPEQQTFAGARTNTHLDVQPATSRPTATDQRSVLFSSVIENWTA